MEYQRVKKSMGYVSDKSEEKEDLIIFSNGPGEISTWVFPIVERIKRYPELDEKYNVILIIHPCQFSSGTEHIYVSQMNLFYKIIPPKEYLKLIFGLKRLRKYGIRKRGIIISLGGDLLHPVLFQFRSRGDYRLYAYTNNPGWIKKYEKIFVRSSYIKKKSIEKGMDVSKIAVTGDLVYSSIKEIGERDIVRQKLSLTKDDLMILFMPGSREFELRYMLPVYLKVIDEITNDFPNIRPYILKSPYIDDKLIKQALLNASNIKEAEVEGGTVIEYDRDSESNINFAIKIDDKKLVPILDGGLEYWGSGVDFAVTIPGTNTIQLAYRNIPTLVVAALNKPEIIPMEGIVGILKWFPGGKIILKSAVKKYVRQFPFASLPNMYMQREIFPELFGVIQTKDIIERLRKIIKEREIEKIRDRLQVFKFHRDPADFIIFEIFKNLRFRPVAERLE